MPRLPYTGAPSIEPPGAPPSDYQNIQVNPNQFGAQLGAATEQLGGEAEKAGEFYASVAATQSANDFLDFSDKALYGDPNDPTKPGLMNMKGADAMRAYPQVVQQINERRKAAMSQLNPLAQQEFSRQAMYLSRWALREAGSHARTQQSAWADEVGKAQWDLTSRQIGQAAMQGDVDTLDQLRERLRDGAVKMAQAKFGTSLSDDVIKDQTAKADQTWVQQQVRALAHSDPAKAGRVLDVYASLLPGDVYDTLKRETDVGVRRSVVAGAANRALGISGAVDPGAVSDRPSIMVAPGQSPHSTGWGPFAAPAIDEMRKAGASDAFIQGAMANGLGEGGFSQPWQAAWNGEQSFGHWQLHQGGELEPYLAAEGNTNPQDTANQTRFLMRRMEEIEPGITKSDDPRHVTDAIATKFEKYAGAAPGQRYGLLQAAQGRMSQDRGETVAGGEGAAGNLEIWGDSLGVGLHAQLNAPGHVHGGDTPQQIFDQIKTQPAEHWQGKTVVLPSGSNGQQMPIVEQTIAYLKQNGANVIAVGYGSKFPEKNAELVAIAQRQGVPVIAAEGVGASEGVHPSPQGYASMAEKIRGHAQPAASAAPVLPPIGAPPMPAAVAAAAPGGATAAAATPIPPAPGSASEVTAQQPQQPNRSGLPPLAEVWRRIAADPSLPDEESRLLAFNHAKTFYDAQEADLSRQERMRLQQNQQAMEAREAEVWHDAYSPNPTITPQQLANDPAFAGHNERRSQMIALVNNPPGTALPPAQSYAAAMSLLDRIRRPAGDPQKITDMSPIYDAAISGKLNKSDFEFVQKQFFDQRTAGGEVFAKRRADFIKAVGPMITKSNPLMGKLDPQGDAQLYNFEWALDRQIDQYRKEGKDPGDLLDPSKPDFMGGAKTLQPYQTPMQSSVRARAAALNAGPVWPAPPATAIASAPGTPGVPPRQPGETPADYLARTGGLRLPGAPAAAVAPVPAVPLR